MSYDTKCFQLAVAFLDDHPALKSVKNAEELAQDIQTTIEDWIEFEYAQKQEISDEKQKRIGGVL